MIPACCECGAEVVSVRGAAFEIKGFEEVRKDGGTNHVLWRERTGVVMCPSCLMKKKLGIDDNQLTFT